MLKGKHIYLRGVEIDDLNFIEALENNPENWLISGTLIPFSRKSIEEYINAIRNLQTDKQCRWIISLASNDECIGAIDLFEYDSIHRRAGVGIIIEEKYRKKGYASQAIDLLIEYSFSHLNLFQLWACIIDNNIASQNLFSKAGFELTAAKKNWIFSDGLWHNEYIYQLINPKI